MKEIKHIGINYINRCKKIPVSTVPSTLHHHFLHILAQGVLLAPRDLRNGALLDGI